jgi:hypothetical protein
VDSTRPATTEELPYLDVRVLKREGLIDYGQEQLEGIASLAWTSCNFGGSRPWFVCPGCDRRAAILYEEEEEMSGAVLCRHCLELGYQSQREGPIARAKRRVEKARARLGPDGSRPKGMHLATYSKLKREYLEDVQEHDALYQERLARLTVSRIKRRRRRRRWRPRG